MKHFIEIPHEQISQEALIGIIDSFILREGTDYGWVEASHQTKFDQVKRQLDRGDIKLVFDPASESVTLLTKQDFIKNSSQR